MFLQNPYRLYYRTLIHGTIRAVVLAPESDPVTLVREAVRNEVPEALQRDVEALIFDEIRRLHEGVIARYKLRLSDFHAWQARRT